MAKIIFEFKLEKKFICLRKKIHIYSTLIILFAADACDTCDRYKRIVLNVAFQKSLSILHKMIQY